MIDNVHCVDLKTIKIMITSQNIRQYFILEFYKLYPLLICNVEFEMIKMNMTTDKTRNNENIYLWYIEHISENPRLKIHWIIKLQITKMKITVQKISNDGQNRCQEFRILYSFLFEDNIELKTSKMKIKDQNVWNE